MKWQISHYSDMSTMIPLIGSPIRMFLSLDRSVSPPPVSYIWVTFVGGDVMLVNCYPTPLATVLSDWPDAIELDGTLDLSFIRA